MAGKIGQLIADALTGNQSSAMAKIAAESETSKCQSCGKSIPAGDKMCSECAGKKSKEESSDYSKDKSSTDTDQEKTSSLTEHGRVDKLAEALDYLSLNPHTVNWAEVVKQAEDVAPGSGTKPQTDEGRKPQTMSTDLGKSIAHKIPTDPKVNRTQLRSDNKEGQGPKSSPTSGVSGSKAGGKNTASLYQKIKQAMEEKSTPEQEVQVSNGSAPSKMQRSTEVPRQKSLISSNDKAGKTTKRQTQEVPKKEMSEHLNEPMASRKGDKTLDQAFGSNRVNEAGAKIASAQSLISKLASSECSCNGAGTCGACKIKNAVTQRSDGGSNAHA